MNDLINNWYDVKNQIKLLERKSKLYRTKIEKIMDHKGTNTLYSDRLRVTRRTIHTPHLIKKNVPKNIWDRYSSISTHNSYYMKKLK